MKKPRGEYTIKIAMIGLDGFGLDAFNIFKDFMPTINKLFRYEKIYEIKTMPPHTPPMWTSMVSGVNPGRHGAIGFELCNYNKFLEVFICKPINSYHINHPRIWEYLSALGYKNIIINFPITYPLNAMILNDSILFPGWDSPVERAYPNELSNKYPYLLKAPIWQRKRVEPQLKYKLSIIKEIKDDLAHKKEQFLKLIKSFKHDFLGIIISETDWIQHYFIRDKNDIKNNMYIQDILVLIDEIVRLALQNYDVIIILSDHDHRTFNTGINLFYPFISHGIFEFSIIKDNKKYTFIEKIVNNNKYISVSLRHDLIRKLFITSIARIVGAKLYPKDIHVFEDRIGFYISDRIKNKISLNDIKELFKKELNINIIERNELFWGENVKYFPEFFIDFYSLPKNYGVINKYIAKKYININLRDHYPNGIITIINNSKSKQVLDIVDLVNSQGTIMPWDVFGIVFGFLTNGYIKGLDSKIYAFDKDYTYVFKKLFLMKRIKSIKQMRT